MSRYIGIRHRVKITIFGDARPTQVVILDDNAAVKHNLETEEDELDFVLGRFVTRWRVVEPTDDRTAIFARHIRMRKKRGSEETETVVPASYDGLAAGDVIAMILGGSGDNFAFTLSRKADEIGATVLRVPPFILKEKRGEQSKDHDAKLLAGLAQREPELFYPVGARDRDLISVREALTARTDAMKARIACEQRLHQRLIGEIFRRKDGLYPQGALEDLFAERKASDAILSALIAEENKCDRELLKSVVELPVYRDILANVTGCGPAIASRIISAVGDVRQFKTAAKFKAFCGVHVLDGGRFARKRKGEVANWQPDARQALFLLGDQFNRRPGSPWGKKLLEYKAKFRALHPPETVNGKKRYSDGHILKMAKWRTVTKFAEWLWREWWRLEKEIRMQADVKQQSAA